MVKIMSPNIRQASLQDFAHLQALISKSARILQAQYYKQSEIETALELVCGIEELIISGNFLVAKHEKRIIGCGGWAIDVSEPQKAELRSFFVHPDFARKGVATQLFQLVAMAKTPSSGGPCLPLPTAQAVRESATVELRTISIN